MTIPGFLLWTRYEDTEGGFDWDGTWLELASYAASGGTYRYTDGPSARFLAWFQGTRVALIALMGPDQGKADLWLEHIDTSGHAETIVSTVIDLYNSTHRSMRVWSSPLLEEGNYYLFVWWRGLKNPVSTGTGITVDAVDIIGTLRPWAGP